MFDHYAMLDHWQWRDMAPTGGGRIAVVGLPGVGKRSMCNALWGWDVLDEDEPSDANLLRNYGVFHLMDVPTTGFDVENALFRLESMELVIYLLDAQQGVTKTDFSWIARLRALDVALVVALNKIDTLATELQAGALAKLKEQLSRPVVPVSANDKEAVRREFLPVILKHCPHLDVALAAEVKGFRQRVANKIIRDSVLQCSLMSKGLETMGSFMTPDSSALVTVQMEMVSRLAALYGCKVHSDQLLPAGMMNVLNWIETQYRQAVEGNNWTSAGALGAASTWMVGRLAVVYYEANLPRWLQWKSNGHGADG